MSLTGKAPGRGQLAGVHGGVSEMMRNERSLMEDKGTELAPERSLEGLPAESCVVPPRRLCFTSRSPRCAPNSPLYSKLSAGTSLFPPGRPCPAPKASSGLGAGPGHRLSAQGGGGGGGGGGAFCFSVAEIYVHPVSVRHHRGHQDRTLSCCIASPLSLS